MPKLGDIENDPIGLTPGQKDLLADRIERQTGGIRDCDLCGHNDWGLNDRIVSPTMLVASRAETWLPDPSLGHPCAMMQCLNCGNTKLISLSILNIDPTEPLPR